MAEDIDVAELEAWAAGQAEIQARFARWEPQARVAGYVGGLLAPLERKNGWRLVQRAGEASPDGMQRPLLASADWDAEAVRDDVRGYVVEQLGDPGGVLIFDLCRERDYAEKPSKVTVVAGFGGRPFAA